MREPGQRSWSPLVAVTASFVLVFLLFPNPFRIPNNNPTASAEYAPVPGKQQDSAESNFSQVEQGTSAGIGAGGLGEGLLGGQPPPPPPPQYRPRAKNCVGDPPRQTEDPLSPPCVPYFEGDNGGATWQGVSRDAIKVVLYNDWGIRGDLTRAWKPTDERQGHERDFNTTYIVRTVKAHLSYFQRRYQTYGRRVHLIGQAAQTGQACDQRRGDVFETVIEYPFAAIHQGNAAGGCYVEDLAKYDVPSFGINWDVHRRAYYVNPGYVWGFYPEQEVEARYSAGFLCNTVVGNGRQFARFAGATDLKKKIRKIGFVYPVDDTTGVFSRLAELLRDYLKRDCNYEFDHEEPLDNENGTGAAPTIMQRMQEEGITTIVCYCSAYPGSALTAMQTAASGQEFFPEWYLDQGSRGFRAIWQQRSTDIQQPPAFGVTHFWRGDAFPNQYHYRAYKEQEPDSAPNTRFNFDIYHMFLNLFEAIQAAGPNLTPDSVETGMFSFHYVNRDNPYVPLGGYGPYNSKAIADYTFVDTGMAWWWDRNGTPPGGSTGEGCIRVMDQGRRFYWNEWPRNDQPLFLSGAPCSQDNTEITDPRPGDV